MRSATLVLDSKNAKIGRAAATYASIASTCPTDCALRDRGCYGQTGNAVFTVRRLDAAGAGPIEAAREEAALIQAAEPVRDLPLRLHVVGDARSPKAARIIGEAAATWRAKRGGPVWAYTHAWRKVLRRSWGPSVSVLASSESTSDGMASIRRGYAPAVVVASHPADGRAYVKDGVRWIPCLEQTRGLTCTKCRLCFDADKLRDRGAGIAFAAHGSQTKRVLKVLQSNTIEVTQ